MGIGYELLHIGVRMIDEIIFQASAQTAEIMKTKGAARTRQLMRMGYEFVAIFRAEGIFFAECKQFVERFPAPLEPFEIAKAPLAHDFRIYAIGLILHEILPTIPLPAR